MSLLPVPPLHSKECKDWNDMLHRYKDAGPSYESAEEKDLRRQMIDVLVSEYAHALARIIAKIFSEPALYSQLTHGSCSSNVDDIEIQSVAVRTDLCNENMVVFESENILISFGEGYRAARRDFAVLQHIAQSSSYDVPLVALIEANGYFGVATAALPSVETTDVDLNVNFEAPVTLNAVKYNDNVYIIDVNSDVCKPEQQIQRSIVRIPVDGEIVIERWNGDEMALFDSDSPINYVNITGDIVFACLKGLQNAEQVAHNQDKAESTMLLNTRATSISGVPIHGPSVMLHRGAADVWSWRRVWPCRVDGEMEHVMIDASPIKDVVHGVGLSCASLGMLRTMNTDAHARALLVTEMAVRIARHLLRARLRHAGDDAHERHALSEWINLCVGCGPKASVFWGSTIKWLIVARYGACLTPRELKQGKDLRIVADMLPSMFIRAIQRLTGVVIDADALVAFDDYDTPSLFDAQHVTINPSISLLCIDGKDRHEKIVQQVMSLPVSNDVNDPPVPEHNGDWEMVDGASDEVDEWGGAQILRGVKDMLRRPSDRPFDAIKKGISGLFK